jgi:hypothetical protein
MNIRLFCCVWALDKLNAAFHGRPVMMHERDIGRDLEACFSQQEPCFQLFLRTVSLLDKVIGLYRPRQDPSVMPEHDFPLFEDLVERSDALYIDSQYLALAARSLIHVSRFWSYSNSATQARLRCYIILSPCYLAEQQLSRIPLLHPHPTYGRIYLP